MVEIINGILNNKCLIDQGAVTDIINLGIHPYADTFIPENLVAVTEPSYPLSCVLCQTCGLVQVKYLTPSEDRYNLYNYSYTMSNSNFSRNHWINFAKVLSNSKNVNISRVLEIGSNDGFLLNEFSKLGSKVIGIDSSKHMVKLANSNGLPTIHSNFPTMFNYPEFTNNFGVPSLIIANNVVNHSNNLINFIESIKKLMDHETIFIFEVPYWASTILSGHFDQIYHEHITYFTVESIVNLLKSTNLELLSIELVDYHGGSLRVMCSKQNLSDSSIDPSLILIESQTDFKDISTYRNYELSIKKTRSEFLHNLHDLKIKHPIAKFIGIGAAAKGNTFLNYYGLNNTYLDFITDTSSEKIGKLTPLTRIPIRSDESLKNENGIVFGVVLSWNLEAEIIRKLQNLTPGELRILN